MKIETPLSVDEYISAFPEDIQQRMNQIRMIVREIVPEAQEVISYGMPAYKLNGMLFYFAGYKNHIGFYPLASGITYFKEEISEYKNAKGSVQFPHNKSLPVELIRRIVAFRAGENMLKKKTKK